MKPTCNAFPLKLFAASWMVLDHIDHIPGLLPPAAAAALHVLTRCVGPLFAFLAVEGFRYTHDRRRYVLRLFGWAAVMAAGSAAYNYIADDPALALHNNIILTLALGVLMLCVLAGFGRDTAVGHRPLRIAGAALLVLAAAMCAEGGAVLLPFMLITYACRARPHLRAGLYLGFALALFAVDFVPYPTLHETLYMLAFNSDFLFVLALPLIACYDGTRGPGTAFAKYFFYLFYPLHLWGIGLLALLTRG